MSRPPLNNNSIVTNNGITNNLDLLVVIIFLAYEIQPLLSSIIEVGCVKTTDSPVNNCLRNMTS